MCRSIKPLFNFDPPATEVEIRSAAVQFVRKLSGFQKPSKVNENAFNQAVNEVAAAAQTLLLSLVTTAEPKDRLVEAARAPERVARRFPESVPHDHTHEHPHDHAHGAAQNHTHGPEPVSP